MILNFPDWLEVESALFFGGEICDHNISFLEKTWNKCGLQKFTGMLAEKCPTKVFPVETTPAYIKDVHGIFALPTNNASMRHFMATRTSNSFEFWSIYQGWYPEFLIFQRMYRWRFCDKHWATVQRIIHLPQSHTKKGWFEWVWLQ